MFVSLDVMQGVLNHAV